MRKINVGIIGFGTVGRGTADVLINNADTITTKSGIEIVLKSVADIRIDEISDELLAKIPCKYKSYEDILNDPEIDIVAELIGGCSIAREIISKALDKGKHVVTANKALLAIHGVDLFKKAEEKSLQLGFEGSVGGGIPIIKVIKEDLVANNIKEIYGVINGTAKLYLK